MRRVLAVVEGQTERGVLKRLLAEHLAGQGVSFHPKVTGKPGHKGGVRSFEAVLKDVINLHRQEPAEIVTTFFDYYGLPADWPGIEAKTSRVAMDAVSQIETSMRARAQIADGGNDAGQWFVPYIQLHELEALLFAEPRTTAEYFGSPGRVKDLELAALAGCELINDSYETCPSRRIERLFPSYRKGASQRASAPLIVGRIGLTAIRAACPRFSHWVTCLESFGKAQL